MTTKKPSGHSHGFMHKARSVMTKDHVRGVSFLLRKFNEGDKALVIIDPSQHKALPHRRYHGKVGTVKGKKGNCYEVTIKDGGLSKQLIVHPVHLKRV